MKSNRIVGFGELLLRLDTPGHVRLTQMDQLQSRFTGGEANVLVAAKALGAGSCSMVSRVPSHAIGDACLGYLARYGLECGAVVRGGERLGILFVESGVSVRPTRVVYDRAHSSFCTQDPGDFDWNEILADANILHITGTAPALGENVNDSIAESIRAARSLGCMVSFDCSYRSALWGIKEAGQAYRRIAKEADILFASPHDAQLFFEIDEPSEEARIQRLVAEYEIPFLAYTDRDQISASVNRLRGNLVADGQLYKSQDYEFEIVDRIGSGDAFAGGLLFSLLKQWGGQQTVEFAAATAVLKHTVPGDFCPFTSEEVLELVNGGGTRIRR